MDLLVLDGCASGHPTSPAGGRRWSGSRPDPDVRTGARAGARRRGVSASTCSAQLMLDEARLFARNDTREPADLRVDDEGRAAPAPLRDVLGVWGCLLRPATSSRSRAAATAPS